MNNQSLQSFIQDISKIWGPLSSELTKKSKQLLEELALNCQNEEWVKVLLNQKSPAINIFKSEEHGFILQAHVEQKEDMSLPHDHGNGWVLYATVQGAVEMGVFHKVVQPNGVLKVVQKDRYIQRPGECNVYLQGDIHDTKAIEDDTLMFRLTSCDFQKEFNEGRLVRYVEHDGRW